MKITVVCDILGKEDNGTTIATMNFIRHLQKHHDVKILCADKTKKGLENYYVVKNKKFYGKAGRFIKATGFTLAKPNKLTVMHAVLGADVVHVFEPFALGMSAIKVANKANIPVTTALHLLPENLTYYMNIDKIWAANAFLYKYWWNNTYKKVDAIHYPTEFVKNIFTKRNPGTAKIRSYVISNGVKANVKPTKVSKPKRLANKIVILCCGRFSPEKDQQTLIRAVKRSRFEKKIQLIFAGQGQKKSTYKKMSRSLTNKPIFKRFKHNDLIKVINYCDLFVHPALIETEGISVLEAITCGKLVLVSDSKKAAPRTFGVDSKCIFESKNPKRLAKLIDFWISNPELKKKYELQNKKLAKKYSFDNCMKDLEQMLYDAIKFHVPYKNKFLRRLRKH